MAQDEATHAAAVTELQTLLLNTAGLEDFVVAVARSATQHIAPDTHVTVTLQRAGRTGSAGSSDEAAEACDQVEYETGEGPCLTAIAEGRTVLVRDVAADDRWPAWRDACAEQGFRSAAGVPAPVREGVAVSLNLYSRELDAWDEASITRAERFAAEVARTVGLCLRWVEQTEINADLRAALASRAVIDQAMGVVMAQNRCSAAEAFSVLRSASQHRNMKLRDVAAGVIESVTGQAPAEPKEFRERKA